MSHRVDLHHYIVFVTALLSKVKVKKSFLIVAEEDAQLLPGDITNDCVAQSWFRFLHILQNPVDLCHPEIISQTPKFLHLALASETVVDPSQHECLRKLPHIFYKAMRGISVMVNAFLGRISRECFWRANLTF